MRKAFDMVEFKLLFSALRQYGLHELHLNLAAALYANQKATVERSSKFIIERGVKQGDIISLLMFNIALQLAFDRWRAQNQRNQSWLI